MKQPTTITIYSLGLIGASIGLALKTSGFRGRIIGLSDTQNRTAALALGCIDEGYPYDALPDCIASTDLLILCSPIGAIVTTLHKLSTMKMPADLVITDIGSTKSTIVTAAAELPSHVHFIGGHPMAGSEKSGAAAADPYLFQNALWVLTPVTGSPDTADQQLAAFFETYTGCRTLFLDPERHDTIASAISHLPHLLAVALTLHAGLVEETHAETLLLAAGGFRDLTRIASSSFGMWRDIFFTNTATIGSQLDTFIERLQQFRNEIGTDALGAQFEKAHAIRSRIPATSKGFLHKLSDIVVRVPDKQGVIASVAEALAAASINIKDIAVLKIREGEGGTLRLSFDTPVTAQKAVACMAQLGFTAWERI